MDFAHWPPSVGFIHPLPSPPQPCTPSTYRLLYSSDYPVPNIPFLSLTVVHVLLGMITWAQKAQLDRYNPLLFNLVLMKTVGRTTKAAQGLDFTPVPPFPLHGE